MITAFIRNTKREYLPIADRASILACVRDGSVDVDFMMAKIVAALGADEAWSVEDRMDWLLQEFCLNAPKALLLDVDYSFNNWEYKNTISLRLKGDSVGLCNGQAEEVDFPRQTLLRGMLDCATDMLQLMRDIHAIRPIGNFMITPGLQGSLAECERLYSAKYADERLAAS